MKYFFAAFLLGLIALGAVATQTSLFTVTAIPVEVQIVNSGSVEHILQQNVSQQISKNAAKLFTNKNIWAVSLRKVRDVVVSEPWVQSVRISRTLPNHVNVVVEPKRAVAMLLVQKAKGSNPELRALASDGSVLKLPNSTAALDVPIARGPLFSAETEAGAEARAKLIEFISSIPNEGSLSTKNIAEITYVPNEGFSLALIPMKSTVLLGSEKIQTKVTRVSQVLDYLLAHQLRGRVIDASFSKKVLVRLRKDP